MRRAHGLDGGAAAPLVVCSAEQRFLVADQLRASGAKVHGMLLEPVAKGTAPALTLAALQVLADDDPVMLVMPRIIAKM